MEIKADFNLSKSYFDNIFQAPAGNRLFSNIKRAFSFQIERIIQRIRGITDEKMWEISKVRLEANFQKTLFGRAAPAPAFSEDAYLFFAKKKFTSILKKGGALCFQKKIDSGEETLEALKEKLKSKGGNVKEILENSNCKNIISILPLSELTKFLGKSSLGEEFKEFISDIKDYLEFSVASLQDNSEKAFVELFSVKELNEEGSWKICFAKRLLTINPENLPEFAREKLGKAREFLPIGFDEKVVLWQKSQDFARTVVDKKISMVSSKIFEGFAIPSTTRTSNDHLDPTSIVEKVAYAQAYKYTEMMPSRPQADESGSFILSYLSSIIELCILQQCFVKYKGQISEEDFLDAYNNWDKFAKDPVDLEKLLEKKMPQAQPS